MRRAGLVAPGLLGLQTMQVDPLQGAGRAGADTMTPETDFDSCASDYEAELNRGLSVSGEKKDYFARRRVAWCAACLAEERAPKAVLDYGCGTGTALPFLAERFRPATLVGVDVSRESLAAARDELPAGTAELIALDDHRPSADIDLAYCNGVFHHIPLADRAEAVARVRQSLRPGGWFSLWENNPWNPGTRLVMKRIPFDRDAIPLSPPVARRLLAAGGFRVVRTDFLFFFPGPLRRLRWLEPALVRFPLGAQYQVLAQREAE